MTALTAHTTTAPATAGRPPAAWAAWGSAWTALARDITGRPDAVVIVAPGAAGGAPARCPPDTAGIAVDADLIGRPDIADPRRPGHKSKVAVAYGALLHECAHVRHTHWDIPPDTPPVVAEAARLLEESRIEGLHRSRRPRDRRWLRAAVTTLIDPADIPVDSPWAAAWAAGLLLARYDARVLTGPDVRPARRAITDVLGARLLRRLRRIWQAAHATADTDTAAILDLAGRWCRALGIDPATQPAIPAGGGTGRTVAAAVTAAIGAIATATATPAGRRSTPAAPPTSGPLGDAVPRLPATWARRAPTDTERLAARHLAAALRAARTREPATTAVPATTPPGRLRTRAAMTAAAQRATGTPPTAQPWQRTTRRPIPDPDLAVAVLVDVSGSMHRFARPMSSAAWILGHAGHRAGAATATIAFGDQVTVLSPPGRPNHDVYEMRADAGTEQFIDAITEADRLLHLTTPGAARLLTVVSDGHFPDKQAAQHHLTRLHAAGCRILWLAPDNHRAHTYRHTTTLAVDNPATCIRLIGRAARRALEQA